jgi:hypothetical protein
MTHKNWQFGVRRSAGSSAGDSTRRPLAIAVKRSLVTGCLPQGALRQYLDRIEPLAQHDLAIDAQPIVE